MKWRLIIVAILLSACTPEPAPPGSKPSVAELTTKSNLPPGFSEVADDVGIKFQHFPGVTEDLFFPEIMGSGVALFDFDSDGDLDVYVLQGSMLKPGVSSSESKIDWPFEEAPINRLYRNELIPQGKLVFSDVTQTAGVGDAGYGMGVAVGDTDNDGDADLFVSNFGPNRFYQNDGNGHFTLVIDAFAVDEREEWTTSASFFDVDKDGDLDLFATNYVGFTLANNIECSSNKGKREYCVPNVYPPTVDRLWRNDGNNKFVDITRTSGIGDAAGNGLGTSATDFDGDGDIDIYVANDLQANRLWTQDSDGKFRDTALMAGSAYNANGEPEASMGVSTGDFDGDGDEDLFMTHLNAETNTLYVNDGTGNFVDHTHRANLAASSLRLTGFGTGWIDYDNDGWLDLFIANGAVVGLPDPLVDPQFPYGQINQLLRNENGRFRDMTAEAGDVLALRDTSRGAALGDIDNDGDIDIVVSNGNGPLRVLRNELGNTNNWLQVRLIGTRSPRDGTGTKLVLKLSDGRELWRRAHTDGSYLSASDIRVHFGLGKSTQVESVSAYWTSGTQEKWTAAEINVDINQQLKLTEGTGQPLGQ